MTIHPCFDGHQHSHIVGRIHIPLIPTCNIKCGYCSRKTSCAHENRPGVSEKVLSVEQSLELVASLRDTNLRIIGLSGPGDPFSDPQKVFTFIKMLREIYGDYYEICISTNGLVLYKYIDLLKEYKVNYITLTINTVNTDTLSDLVDWITEDGVVYQGKIGAERLLNAQLRSLKAVVEAGIRCKVNTVIVPDVNQYEITDLLKTIKEIGAEKGNLIPLIPVRGTRFEKVPTLAIQEYDQILKEASTILSQVVGCKKCRADAAFVVAKAQTTCRV